MIALGIVLVVLSGVFALGVTLSNTSSTQAEAFGVSLSNVTLGGIFLAGVVTGAVLLIGLTLLLAGAARKRHRRRAVKAEVKGVRTERAGLAEDNLRLQEELADQRRRAVLPVTSNPYPRPDRDEVRAADGREDEAHDAPEDATTRRRPGRFGR